ncbi:MAG: hypothetical protein NT049_17630 [Planctomycetota bacterium]|nr:hypothetical protein [Planctomycetota bacterium]
MKRLGITILAATVGMAAFWAATAYAGVVNQKDPLINPGKAPPQTTAPAAPAAPAATAPEAAPPAKGKPDLTKNPGRTIRGKLTPPDRVKEAVLWERSMDVKIPVKVDPKTGEFEVKGLRMGTYDFLIRTPWGRLEGLDMAPKVSPYDILIPLQYRTSDLGLDAEGTFTEEDKKAIHRIIYEVKRYENKIRDMYLSGSADKSVALMELLMDQGFVGRKGDEITWRVEQWYYEKKYDAWQSFRVRVLYRFRISKAVFDTWGWQFEPALGGFDITADRKEPITVEYVIPEKPMAEKGLTGTQYPPAEKGILKDPKPPEMEDK